MFPDPKAQFRGKAASTTRWCAGDLWTPRVGKIICLAHTKPMGFGVSPAI